ncbi:hypothetical protein ACFOKI_03340 [Sphingomonas qilianensis]|uniref:Sugar transporter n=1 Tax=Sphingomonas qilianensis TaxID=1736690 RepID=A0ABU9XVA1_9SPHN
MTVLRKTAPARFWIISLLITLWGAIGVAAFYLDVTTSPAAVAQMSDYDRTLRASRPDWFMWLYGAATWAGLLGGLLLLRRLVVARAVLIVALVLVVAMFGYIFAVTDLIAVKGVVTAAGFPIALVLIAAAQIWFATHARRHGWIV